MKKILLGSLILLSQFTFAGSTQWVSANQAYLKGNLSTLSNLANAYPNDNLINYLNAAANLSRNNPALAVNYINKHDDDNYFSVDLMHQLLNYFFNNQNWQQYINVYENLPEKQASSNETCGYDVANFALNKNIASKSNFKYLASNKLPLWCVSLVASEINNGNLGKSYLQPFLYNLIINDQLTQFNQLAGSFNYNKVNFTSSVPSTQLNNRYQIVYRISNISKKSPETAYSELANANVDSLTRKYLYNLLASNLAIKQNFDMALDAINRGSDEYLSDDEYEWRVRIFLATKNWQSVIDTINMMPDKLQAKNAWLYWKAYAYGKLGQKSQAQDILSRIPLDYSYYALLAQSELRQNPDVDDTPPTGKISSIKYSADAQLSFELYRLGKQGSNSNFVRLATQNLYYVIGQSEDRDIAIISQTAFNYGWNEMGIYAGNKMNRKYASLSFPILFRQAYQKYSQANGIEMSYPMAVTRQESRFNPNALAFDGGVGLMQIMPGTANYIAKKSHSSNCYKSYDCNIKFGSWYLSHLNDKFGNNLIYSTAGYNAGPNRAHRWQQAFAAMDNSIQIELIPFKITRDYVQKVLTNKVVYDSRLNNSKKLDLLQYLNKINNQNSTFIVDDDNTTGDSNGISN